LTGKKRSAPPIDRPQFSFGLDEFIELCRRVKAEPLITISDYTGSPQDAAHLVEYLNAPAKSKYPWAMKRAAWGHPRPFKVKYFELGNESEHGNHETEKPKRFTAEAYVLWSKECIRLMRQKDPKIKIGAVMSQMTDVYDPWNYTVLERLKKEINFVIVHQYAVRQFVEEDAAKYTPEQLMTACLASGAQLEAELAAYREFIRRIAGKNLPVALTEYNALFWGDRPFPYRFSLGAALFSADHLRVLMKSEYLVLTANYWHFINGSYGLVQGPGEPDDKTGYKKMAAFYLFRLWAKHFGDRLVSCTVENPPTAALEAQVLAVKPAVSSRYQPEKTGKDLLAKAYLDLHGVKGVKLQKKRGGQLKIAVDNLSGDRYLQLSTIPCTQNTPLLLSFEAKAQGNFKNSDLGLGLTDTRGWDATHSGIKIGRLEDYPCWTQFRSAFYPIAGGRGAGLFLILTPGTIAFKEPSGSSFKDFPLAVSRTSSLSRLCAQSRGPLTVQTSALAGLKPLILILISRSCSPSLLKTIT